MHICVARIALRSDQSPRPNRNRMRTRRSKATTERTPTSAEQGKPVGHSRFGPCGANGFEDRTTDTFGGGPVGPSVCAKKRIIIEEERSSNLRMNQYIYTRCQHLLLTCLWLDSFESAPNGPFANWGELDWNAGPPRERVDTHGRLIERPATQGSACRLVCSQGICYLPHHQDP